MAIASSTPQSSPRQPSPTPARGQSVNARILRLAWRSPEMKVASALFLALCLLTLFGPFIIDASATKISVADKFLPPVFMDGGKLPYFLGTDQLGRDLLLSQSIADRCGRPVLSLGAHELRGIAGTREMYTVA